MLIICVFILKLYSLYMYMHTLTSVSADDTYSIHFVKRVKVVHIVDVHNQQYSVPINSCIEFGVAFDFKTGGRYGGGSSSGILSTYTMYIYVLVYNWSYNCVHLCSGSELCGRDSTLTEKLLFLFQPSGGYC